MRPPPPNDTTFYLVMMLLITAAFIYMAAALGSTFRYRPSWECQWREDTILKEGGRSGRKTARQICDSIMKEPMMFFVDEALIEACDEFDTAYCLEMRRARK